MGLGRQVSNRPRAMPLALLAPPSHIDSGSARQTPVSTFVRTRGATFSR
jgi:hypothetical protein